MVEIVFLLIGLLIISGCALSLANNDYLSPSAALPIMFLLCVFAAQYNYARHETPIGFDAVILILFTTTMFCIAAQIASIIIKRKKDCCTHYWRPNENAITAPSWLIAIVIIFCIVSTYIYYRALAQSLSALGLSGDWNQMMNIYRLKTTIDAYGEVENVGGIANIMYKMMIPIAYLFSYIGINNLVACKRSIAKQLPLFLPALMFCICTLLTGGRMGILRYGLGTLTIIWIIFNARQNWAYRLKISAILKVICLIIAGSMVFWIAGFAVGRQITNGPLDYICNEIGYSMVLFSDYLHNPSSFANNLFGAETFNGMYNSLGRILGVDDFIYTYHLPWGYYGDVALGNVYTAYRYWYHDFGPFMILVAVFYGIFYSVFYEKARLYSKERLINYPLLMYSYFVYGLFLIPLMDCLLATEIVISTPLVLIVMYCLGRYIESKQAPREQP